MKAITILFFAASALAQTQMHAMMNGMGAATPRRFASEGSACTTSAECQTFKYSNCWWAQSKCEEENKVASDSWWPRVGAKACPKCDSDGQYVSKVLQTTGLVVFF